MHTKHIISVVFLLTLIITGTLPAADKAQAKNSNLYSAKITLDKEGKLPSRIHFTQGKQPTVASFFKEFRQVFQLPDVNQMKAGSVSKDKLGTHHRFNQYYKGIEILAAQFILHEKNGRVWYANGNIVPDLDIDVSPSISEQAALEAALKHINAETYMWQNPANEVFIKKEQKNPDATFQPKGELKLTSGREEMTGKNVKLVYRFDIYAEKPLGRYWVDVDAKTGAIINQISRIQDADAAGSGASLYNGTVSMIVDEVVAGSSYRLQENDNTVRGADIRTFDMMNGTDYGAATDFTSTAASGPWDGGGVSGHWGAEATYDYYYNAHGRNSLDDAGFALLSYIHFSVNYNNAFWDGSRMTYGDGDGVNFTPLIGLDVCGHELTHGVTEFTSNLIYFGESGALNESFSDIFGNLVEFDKEGAPGVGTGSWRVGEDITTSGLGIRNMENPNEFNDPDTYEGTYWASTTGGDNGGVHTNSGVQNFWFYLLVEGGSGTNDNGDAYSVTGIGLVDAAAIAYHNNTNFLTPSATYDDARNGAVACAEALFGVGSQQALSTAAAWDAVGVDGIAPPPPPVPANDDCANAIAIACGSTVAGTTIGATFDAAAPYCDFAHTAPGVWYTVSGTGDVMIATMCGGPTYDARLTVYEGTCGTLACVTADDDGCGPGSVSRVAWPSTSGTTYHILVHGWSFSQGNFELAIVCPGAPQPALTGVCYASGGNADGGNLYTINPSTGAATLIGATGFPAVPGLAINSAGEIYGTTTNLAQLIRIDAATGYATTVGSTGIPYLEGIAFDAGDVLYGLDFYGTLYTISTSTAAVTPVGTTTSAVGFAGLAFDPKGGTLYASVAGFTTNPDAIFTIDKNSGTETLVGTTGVGFGSAIPDICFDANGNLLGSRNIGGLSGLVAINKATGAGAVIGNTGIAGMSGMACFVIPGTYDIYVADVRTGGTTRVTTINNADEYNPSFSHDGKKIVHDVKGGSAPFGHSIYVTDVSSHVSTPLPGGDGGNDASWSPNGQYIAFDRTPAGDPGIYIVPAGGGPRTLVRANGVDAEWSNNSKRLAFQDITDGSIRTVDVHDGSETTVASGGANPSWSPDGKSIAYTNGNNIFSIRVDESGVPKGSPVQLTSDGAGVYNQQPSWSNNSKTVVFHSNRVSGDFDIWTVPASGGSPSLLAGNPAFGDYDPCYSVSGQQVAYAGFTRATAVNATALAKTGVTLQQSAATIPDAFGLEQNFPNPFNPTTTIQYALPTDARVTLEVYDVLGRRVAELVNGQVAAGYHNVSFDGSKLASGIYFYRLNADDGGGKPYTQVRKLILMK